MVVALVFTTTPTEVQAQTYTPVFYYYHGDHLGSSSVMTDRSGAMVQHYEYAAFGNERFKDNTSAVDMSNRYTGQQLDEETGLYYYGARYYDPELGRFTQPDTIVPNSSDSQQFNRYTYVNNNPLKYTDPSGHELLTAIIIGVVVGAAIGGATAAATGGNIGMGILTGAIGGLFGGVGAWAGGAIGAAASGATTGAAVTAGSFAGAVAGGAAGGAVSAAVTGGNIGMGALTGAVSGAIGFGVSWFNAEILKGALSDFAVASLGGGLGGGIGSELQGGSFWEGAAYGAAGGAIGSTVAGFIKNKGWNAWKDLEKTGRAAADEGDALVADAANEGLDSQINDNKYGHASNMSRMMQKLGPIGAPFALIYGAGYELWTIIHPGHPPAGPAGTGFFDGQNPLNWSYDTPGDMLANSVGVFSGLLFSPNAASVVNKSTFLIPGPNYSSARHQGNYSNLSLPEFWHKAAPPGASWPW